MSIEQILKDACVDGRLVRLSPLLANAPRPRVFYAVPFVAQQLSPETVSPKYEGSVADLRARVDNFIMGRTILIGDRKSRIADWKRLEPAEYEIWELRKREKPGARIFGRFIKRDVFFASGIRLRRELSEFGVWSQECRNCKAKWRQIFHPHEPLKGTEIHDYITGAHPESILNE